jgi:hypothetical protein
MSELTLPSTGIKIIKKSYRAGSLRSPDAPSSPEPAPEQETNTEKRQLQDAAFAVSGEAEDTTTVAEQAMSLTHEQKEDLIEKMETKKYKLKMAYRESRDPEIERQYREVKELLAKVKECDAVDRMKENITAGSTLASEFKKKIKQLAVSDFNRIIDLTGSKEGRKPDIATETWLKGRTVVFKDKGYRPPPEDKVERFTQKMQLKQMPSDIKKMLDQSISGNLQAAGVKQYNPDALKYKKYNPLEFQGLSAF